MKTRNIFRILMVVIILSSFLSQPAVASTPASVCAATIWQKFQNKIKYPEKAVKKDVEGDVTVIFTVADNGNIVIKFIRSTDRELISYIKNILSSVQVPELDNASIYDFKVVFHFKLI
jgi:outer membrane biosynthesis protein TonB